MLLLCGSIHNFPWRFVKWNFFPTRDSVQCFPSCLFYWTFYLKDLSSFPNLSQLLTPIEISRSGVLDVHKYTLSSVPNISSSSATWEVVLIGSWFLAFPLRKESYHLYSQFFNRVRTCSSVVSGNPLTLSIGPNLWLSDELEVLPCCLSKFWRATMRSFDQ